MVHYSLTFHFFFPKLKNIGQLIWDNNNVYAPGPGGEPLNDWVIMKLSSPLILNVDVQPACLPVNNWAPENDNNLKQKCFTSGWGTTSSGLMFYRIKLILSIMTLMIYYRWINFKYSQIC